MAVMKDFLSPSQRQTLRTAHKLEKNRRFADRIKAVLAVDAGEPVSLVAKILLVDETTVRRYIEAFAEEGLEGLANNKHPGALPRLSVKELDLLDLWVEEQAPGSVQEVRDFILKEFEVEYCRSQVNSLLKKMGFSYVKPKLRPALAKDDEQEKFKIFYSNLKASLQKDELIYFGDGAHPLHNSKPSYGWMRKGAPRVLKTNPGRNRLNFHGAVSAQGPRILVQEVKKMNSEEVLRLFAALERRHPTSRRIHFICDNASYYRSEKVARWLKNSRIKIHYLPAYSPNLNLAERIWKLFRREVMNNQFYESFYDFRKACGSYFRRLSRRAPQLKIFFSDNFQTLPALS